MVVVVSPSLLGLVGIDVKGLLDFPSLPVAICVQELSFIPLEQLHPSSPLLLPSYSMVVCCMDKEAIVVILSPHAILMLLCSISEPLCSLPNVGHPAFSTIHLLVDHILALQPVSGGFKVTQLTLQ